MADINLSWDLDERQLLEGLNRIERRLNDIEDEFGASKRGKVMRLLVVLLEGLAK